jgi:DNA-binding transcriptional ArsR family regulator
VATKRTGKAIPRVSKADNDARLVKALSHPIRARALSILNEEVASPKMIAAALGLPIGTVGHHVKQLLALECIELVKTEPRRGATEHFYRGTVHSVLDEEQWARLNPDSKTALSIEWLKMLNQAAKEALVAKTFDSRTNRHLTRTPVTVDEQGWEELMSLLGRVSGAIQGVELRSSERERAGESVGQCLRATVALLGFESPPLKAESAVA